MSFKDFDPLVQGSIKHAVAAACAVVLGMPALDPEHFSILKLGGVGRILIAIAWFIIVAEARYWKQWANKIHNGEER